MEINTFDIVKVDFGEANFSGEQGGVRSAVVIQNYYGNLLLMSRTPVTLVMG